jgi:CheY-like chemotaxis protein
MEREAATMNGGKTVHILVVEDDDVDAMAVERAFKRLKLANPTHRARDGLEALALLRGEGQPALPRPFIVLLDLAMPRMNGLELLETLRGDPALRSTVVFVLTTSHEEKDRVSAYNLNVAGYMVKDNVGDDFLRVVTLLEHYWRVVELP